MESPKKRVKRERQTTLVTVVVKSDNKTEQIEREYHNSKRLMWNFHKRYCKIK